MSKLLCFFGWHRWEWTLKEGDSISLSGPPPPHAKCTRCSIKYGD